MARRIDEDELIEQWTLIGDEFALLVGRTGPSKLALALLLKFYTQHGRFPIGRAELHDDAVAYVATQVKVPASDLGLFEWSGRTMERHRSAVRTFLGFRECSVADAEKLTQWLADHVCCKERRVERVREALLAHMRAEKIEPPARVRLGRMIGSALRLSEETLTARISSRIPRAVISRIGALIADASDGAEAGDEGGGDSGPEVWASIKSDPGNVSLRTTQKEVGKLASIRAVKLPPKLFSDIAPKILAGWRARAAVEAPSHLRVHPDAIKWTLISAYLRCREREITDTLVELLIATVQRINARSEAEVRDQFVSDFVKKVAGKENILFNVILASVEEPQGLVEDVVYPAAGGLGVMIDLLHEFKAKGPTYLQAKQRIFKASYTNHYRTGLIELLQALEFRSTNTAHKPVLEGLELIKRYKAATTNKTQYYAQGETVPVDG